MMKEKQVVDGNTEPTKKARKPDIYYAAIYE
jgi:hypothetical protein